MTKSEIEAVNRAVNNSTKYEIPLDYHWSNSDDAGKGMCADQAIAKIERCRAAGIDRDDCRFAEVTVEPLADPNANREHALACFRDDVGHWWAADIRHPYLMEPAELPYTWHRWRRSFADPWTTVEWG